MGKYSGQMPEVKNGNAMLFFWPLNIIKFKQFTKCRKTLFLMLGYTFILSFITMAITHSEYKNIFNIAGIICAISGVIHFINSLITTIAITNITYKK